MEYGPIDKEQKEELEKSLALETITYDTFNRGFFICLQRDGQMLFDKKASLPLAEMVMYWRRRRKWGEVGGRTETWRTRAWQPYKIFCISGPYRKSLYSRYWNIF